MKKKPDKFIVVIMNQGRLEHDWCILHEQYADSVGVKWIIASDLTLGEAQERLAHIKLAKIAVRLFPA